MLGSELVAKPQKRSRWPVAALGVLLMLSLLLGIPASKFRDRWWTGRNRAVVAPVSARRSVAVIGFTNVSGNPESAWVSTALSEMFATELAAGDKLRIIPGENV